MDLAARWADPTRDHRHRAQDFAAHDRAIPSLCGFDNRFLSWVSGSRGFAIWLPDAAMATGFEFSC